MAKVNKIFAQISCPVEELYQNEISTERSRLLNSPCPLQSTVLFKKEWAAKSC